MGQLIVIEGLDGSGKATQANLLFKRLTSGEKSVKAVTFPDYESESSCLVQMYLRGDVGTLEEVNVYAATSFYAADRYISFQTQWKDAYEKGQIIVADRYSTSNIIYQMGKLPRDEWDSYLLWLSDYEFSKLGLPKPTTVLYLDVNPEVSRELLNKRYHGDKEKQDLHEKNLEYLFHCREVALFSAKKLGWEIIDCTPHGEMLTVEEIANKIDSALKNVL